MKLRCPFFALLSLSCLLRLAGLQAATEEAPYGLEARIPWTTSRVIGTPEPPLPYTTVPAFTNVAWKNPLYVAPEPGTDLLVIIQQGGDVDRPSRILRIPEAAPNAPAEPWIEIPRRLVYGLTFHPGYRTNGYVYIFSNGTTGETERTNRISRFTVSRTAPYAVDPSTELRVIEWRSAGHDGGDLAFALDGTLFISTGDGTSDSDGWDSGQTVNDLLGAVLRIDVDHPEAGHTYSVPRDNPFVNLPGARPEIWAYGLRNPWRLTVDRQRGHLWVGNNGQDLWESAHWVRPGENYGWSVYEGSHPFYLNRRRGPTPIVAPTIEHHHSEARSLTGGVVYYGEPLPDLNGVYIYGDHSTGRIWGGRHDGQRLVWHRELAATSLQITGFGVGHRGDLYITDIGGTIQRLIPAPPKPATPEFPRKLSETGVFASVPDQKPAPGVIPYSVNAPGWTDGASVERWLALPGHTGMNYSDSRGWAFADGAVLVQTLSLPRGPEPTAGQRRVETRLFTKQDGRWAGYSYRWNEAQTDAELVDKAGSDAEFNTGSSGPQRWHFPSRAECLACHSRAANFVLGLSAVQMNREFVYANGVRDNQIRALGHIGVLTNAPQKNLPSNHLVDPYAEGPSLEARARSYLHANCSVCHVEAGGGNARMQLEFTTAAEKMELVAARPQHDSFGLTNAMLVAPGEPARSVILQRLSRRGRGQMPPLVSTVVDDRAVQLMRSWIQSLPPVRPFVQEWKLADLEAGLDEAPATRSRDAGRSAFRDSGCVQCHRFGPEGGSVGPDLTEVGRRLKPREILESILEPSRVIAPEYANSEIELSTGEIIVGRPESDTADRLVIRAVAAEDPVTIVKAQIRRVGLSKISNMPSGIANSLQRAQILDLVAYLVGGQP